MAHELQAPNNLPVVMEKINMTKVFTAGSIEMGKAIPWQDKIM